MRHVRERFLLALILVGGPVLLYVGIIRPSRIRMQQVKERRDAAERTASGALSFLPVKREERQVLDALAPQVAQRLPWVEGDEARLSHYSRVVSELHQVWTSGGIQIACLRSSWDPIRASFTLPGIGPASAFTGAAQPVPPTATLQHWMLEARLEPPTTRLFQALDLLPRVGPVLEPVGFRWSFDPATGRQQALLMRNHLLAP